MHRERFLVIGAVLVGLGMIEALYAFFTASALPEMPIAAAFVLFGFGLMMAQNRAGGSRTDFYTTFGMEASSKEDWYLYQGVVDATLKRFALCFIRESNDEAGMIQVARSNCNPDMAIQLQADLRLMRNHLKYAKDSFWRAHGLAKKFGFEVRGKVSDYQTDEKKEEVRADGPSW